jgi:hypothetical protein
VETSRIRVKVVEEAKDYTARYGWYGAVEMTEAIAQLARHAGAAHVEIERAPDGAWKLTATGARGETIISAKGVSGPRPIGVALHPDVRAAVIERDGDACFYCGERGAPLHIDHVLATSRGGTDQMDNLVVACAACNVSKGDALVEEWFTRRFQGQRALRQRGIGKPWLTRIDKTARKKFAEAERPVFTSGRETRKKAK